MRGASAPFKNLLLCANPFISKEEKLKGSGEKSGQFTLCVIRGAFSHRARDFVALPETPSRRPDLRYPLSRRINVSARRLARAISLACDGFDRFSEAIHVFRGGGQPDRRANCRELGVTGGVHKNSELTE
jgi:hypothetical protein